MKKLLILLLIPFFTFAQDELLEEIDTKKEEVTYEYAAFKALKIVNFESTKLANKGLFYMVVSHRFGSVKYGIQDLFGFDSASTRLNFIYGINDWLNVGVSRSSYNKKYETSLKYRILRQKGTEMPITLVAYSSVTANTALDVDNIPGLEFKHRLAYVLQALVSRKINSNFSVQLMPSFLYKNLVLSSSQSNAQFIMGIGGRHKLTKRLSVNMDYGYHINRASDSPFMNPLSIGLDIETGGHVFQLHFTNTQAMNANGFLNEGNGDFTKGDFFFGFNVSRVF